MFRNDKDRLNWLWLIEHAAIDETTISINNKPVKIQRGQLSYSLSYLAKAWGCNLSYVRSYLKHLKLWHSIDTQNDKGQTLITICNYSKFQDVCTENDKGYDEKVASRSHSDRNNKKNYKELKNKEYIIGDASPPKTPKAKKGSRLPDDWECSTELGTWAMDEFGMTRDDVAQEIYAFQDYWKSATGQKAIKLDWDATFRNWIRNNVKWSKK